MHRLRLPGLFIGFVVVIGFLLHKGLAITCYQCNSAYDPRCGDPFDSYSLGSVNCSLKTTPDHLSNYTPSLCRKIIQKVYGQIRVVRGCGYINDSSDRSCLQRTGTHDVMVHYCSCDYDLCNGSMTLSLPFSVLVTVLFIKIFVGKFTQDISL